MKKRTNTANVVVVVGVVDHQHRAMSRLNQFMFRSSISPSWLMLLNSIGTTLARQTGLNYRQSKREGCSELFKSPVVPPIVSLSGTGAKHPHMSKVEPAD